MKTIYFFTFTLALLLSAGLAQDVISGDDYDLDNLEPVGGVDYVYEPYDSVDTGAIILRQSTPTDQHANFDVVGPFDYWEHFDFSDDPGEEFILDDLAPGLYSVAATDEGLELAHTVVEVRAGEAVAVDANLGVWDEGYLAGSYDPYSTYGTYEGYEDVYPGYPYGAYTVGPYEAYGAADVGAIAISGVGDGMDVVVTGPNGYSQGFESDAIVEDLAPGVYAVAASGAGSDLSVTTVEVQGGQQLPLTPGMTGVADADLGGSGDETMLGVGAGLYDSWDVDDDSSISVEEYETGLYGTLAGDDDLLDETEFNETYAGLYGSGFDEEFVFSDYDADADGFVDENEFTEAFDTDLYDSWDVDGDSSITAEEFDRGWFNVIDADDDGSLIQEEYTPYTDWFGYDYDAFGVGDEGLSEDAWLSADF